MRGRAFFAAVVAVLLPGCGEQAISGWDQLDVRYRPQCAPVDGERVLHAWKGGKRYCFHYTIERAKPLDGPAVIIATASELPQTN